MTELSEMMLAKARSKKNDFTDFLKRVVEIETPSTEPETLAPFFEAFGEKLDELGYKHEVVPGNTSGGQLLARPANQNTFTGKQLMIGHGDTVWPVDQLKEMSCHIDGNVMAGPGIYDMKSGDSMILFAIECIQELNLELEVEPVVMITSDEEIGSNDSKEIIDEYAKACDRCLVLEPALHVDGKIKTARKGVGMYYITVYGKSSHAGLAPEEGASAILEMSHIIQTVYELNDQSQGTTLNVGTIEGGERSNVVAAKSRITVEVRITKQSEAERIDKAIKSLKPVGDNIRLHIEGQINRMPMEKTEGTTRLWDLTYELGQSLGMELKDGMSGGASDGNFTNMYTPTIDGLGAVGDGAHALHEHILIDETVDRIALLAMLMLQPIGTQKAITDLDTFKAVRTES